MRTDIIGDNSVPGAKVLFFMDFTATTLSFNLQLFDDNLKDSKKSPDKLLNGQDGFPKRRDIFQGVGWGQFDVLHVVSALKLLTLQESS